MTTTKKKPKTIVYVAGGLVGLCVILAVISALSSATRSPADKTATAVAATATQAAWVEQMTATAGAPTNTSAPTKTPAPTSAPTSTPLPAPTKTPIPPTATPDPNLLAPGTYLVGSEIKPGLYRGQAGSSQSCYWARLKDLAGGMDSILANDNATGKFFVQVLASDKALTTKCALTRVSD